MNTGRKSRFALLRRAAAGGAVAISLALLPSGFAEELPALAQARRALNEGIPQVAIEGLQAALDTPGFPPRERSAARRLLAEAQLATHDADAALKTLAEFTDSSDAAATLLRAHAYTAAGRWGEALAIYEALTADAHAPVEAVLGEAESLQALGRTAEALPILDALVKSDRAPNAARLRRASLLVELDRPAEARQALKATPVGTIGDESWRRYIEARILLAEGNPKGALAILEPMLHSGSGEHPEGLSENLYAAATLALAEANLTPGNPDAATKILETFIKKNPESSQLEIVFRRLDQLYALDKTPQEGVMQLFAIDLPPRAAALSRYYLTQMQMRQKRYTRASESIGQFLAKFPHHSLVPKMYALRAEAGLKLITPEMAPEVEQKLLSNAEADLTAASELETSEEMKAELALRTALVELRERKFLRAATLLQEAKKSPRLRAIAQFDGALAWLIQEQHALFGQEFSSYLAENPPPALAGQLLLEQGLVKARAGDAGAAAALQNFLRKYPAHPRRAEAQLALAELAYQQGRTAEAIVYVQAVAPANPSPEIAGHAEYLAIFLEDAKQPRNEDRVITLARSFIEKYPHSPLGPEVRMKLGQIYFQREDYLNAQEQFENVAASLSDDSLTEKALFLAGQCGTKLFSDEAHNHALELFDKVAAKKGLLEPYARLQQAILKGQLGAEDDAVKIYNSILATNAPDEVRFSAMIGKGDNLAALAKKDPKQGPAAMAAYDQVLAVTDAEPSWTNQASYKKARVLLQLGREGEALVVLNQILDKNSGPGGRETFWLSRAGVEAATLLEGRQEWKSAIGIYEKMAKIPGPHVTQATQRIKALRLEHFLWE
jgi:outer membrane protein assembly factor BamD (BamD/ComL family)